MGLIKKVFELFVGREKLSESAISIANAFDNDAEGEIFLDTVLAGFDNFDHANTNNRNKCFSSDVDFILKCVLESLSSHEALKKLSTRIESYLYIYRRLAEYCVLIRHPGLIWACPYESGLNQLKDRLYTSLTQLFSESKGLQPNLCIRNKDILRRINVVEHLRSIMVLDQTTMALFLTLSKLSLKSSILMEDEDKLTWRRIFFNITYVQINFQEFISHYIKYKEVFHEFPLDIPDIIGFINKHPMKSSEVSPFLILIRRCKDLELNTEECFKQYETLFQDGIKRGYYYFQHIGDLLSWIGRNESWFTTYFNIYASSVHLDILWKMFLYLSEKSELNNTIQNQLILKLTNYIIYTPIDRFFYYTSLVESTVQKIKDDKQQRFIQIYEKIFDAYVNKNLTAPIDKYLITENNMKKLLDIGLKMCTTPSLQRSSCRQILQCFLFNTNTRLSTKFDRIKTIFQKLNNFDQDLCENTDPSTIIEDGWLQDCLLSIPADILKYFDTHNYNDLCSSHQNNRWSIYIWKRITHLSILKSELNSKNGALLNLNDWLKTVKHHVYDIKDTLTVILVINLFELVLIKFTNSILSLPNIDIIIDIILNASQEQLHTIDVKLVDDFVENAKKSIRQILLLQVSCSHYGELLNSTIFNRFLQSVDVNEIMIPTNAQLYKFPTIPENIQSIISSQPDDINIDMIGNNEEFFHQFIRQVNTWLAWFDQFMLLFFHIIEWMKNWNVDNAVHIFDSLKIARNDQSISVSQMKTTIEKALKLLRSLSDLRQICSLFSSLKPWQSITDGRLDTQTTSEGFIRNLKLFRPNDSFIVQPSYTHHQEFFICERQNVQWLIASERLPCNIEVKFQTADRNNSTSVLFKGERVSVDRLVLRGEFETQQPGKLIIFISNPHYRVACTVWYRLIKTPLSTSHLFQGILHMYYQQYYQQSMQTIKEEEFYKLVNYALKFVDQLLDGSISLRDIADLKAIFRDKNIHVKEEVKKLFTSRSYMRDPTDREIEQVCEWLHIYQYYSHINTIIDCIETFEILPVNSDDDSIGHLKRLSDESCSLKDITKAYEFIKQQFQNLSSHHLHLIKTAVEYSLVVQTMKKFDVYSSHGRRRFQELRDDLTTKFQFQERNNMILNSLIITNALCEPFVIKAHSFDDFVKNVAGLSNFEENSVNHMQIVNENIQIITMWLSAEETTVLDNALITMGHLYASGRVRVHLRRLMNEQSYLEITYSIDNKKEHSDEQHKSTTIHFTMSMSDIEDHKRQLTFCNDDLQENMLYQKILLNEQLNLLNIVDKIYSMLVKLEMSGHPDYQMRQEEYEIFDRTGEINNMLSDVDKGHIREDRLKYSSKTLTNSLELISCALKTTYQMWIQNLELIRQDNCLLNLFSSRQIMIMIILLTTSTTQYQLKCHFLEKILSLPKSLTNQEDKEFKLTKQCLAHYLRSLRIRDCDLSEINISELYERHKILPNLNIQVSIKNLSQFLDELFNNGTRLSFNNEGTTENQQYFVQYSTKRSTSIDRSSLKHDLDIDTCCILLNIFNGQLPALHQILWCSTASENDIRLFFARVRTFHSLTFAVMDIDKMHHRLRELLLNEQDALTRENKSHGPVYYFSQELINRRGLKPFHILPQYRNYHQTHRNLVQLFQQNHWTQPLIRIIYGRAGMGKTHLINTKYRTPNTICFSINDTLNLSSLISALYTFDSKNSNAQRSVFFNISIHAPFEELNHAFLSLFVCGSLMDAATGLTFSLPEDQQWEFFIEIPHTDKYKTSIQENFQQILPLLSILCPERIEEVTDENYQLFIGPEEELVARFLKAFQDRTIDRILVTTKTGQEIPVDFDKLTDFNECRSHIYKCMAQYASDLPRNKISEISFTKFLYRRAQFFTNFYYRFNMTQRQLGSTAMKQMINEAMALSKINFQHNNYHRIYFVYDPNFSLHLLHNGWINVPQDIKNLFNGKDPLPKRDFQNKDYFAECLSWLINIKYDNFMKITNETKFILTENFAYKLFHVHERKLTRLPLIIEGETGVGKTFLLKFYSLLLNSNITNGSIENDVSPCILERTSLWLLKTVIHAILEKEPKLLNLILQRAKPKLSGLDGELLDDQNDANFDTPFVSAMDGNEDVSFQDTTVEDSLGPNVQNQIVEDTRPKVEIENFSFLEEICRSLENYKYNYGVLSYMWKTILLVAQENSKKITYQLTNGLYEYITRFLINYPLADISSQLQKLLSKYHSSNIRSSIEIFKEFLMHTTTKPLFYRLLLHPGVTEKQLEQFMSPLCQLAREIPNAELVIFFDEVNTSSCLGLFKEMFIDRTLYGKSLPNNLFFTAAINPFVKLDDDDRVHRRDYLVHQLPQALENLKISYGPLDSTSLKDYIDKKIAKFRISSTSEQQNIMPLERYAQEMLSVSILNAQDFCESYLGSNSVSQREIQRCFNLIDFFWKMRFDDEIVIHANDSYQPNPVRCIALSLALTYYFRLPTREDNEQRNDNKTPTREQLEALLSRTIPSFSQIIQYELEKFVNTDNFVIPQGVAVNQAVREHIFAIVVSIATRTPLCIIGAPGQSKTLSFQIVLQNLQGAQLSVKPFCKRLPAVDPFFCLGSKYTRSEDIAYVFERALKREQQYEKNRINTRCVVFLDEASLPDESKMILKVLHPYLDDCKVAFVAIANRAFDAANANRMTCVYRSLPSKDDQKILSYGCLGLPINDEKQVVDNHLQSIIYGLCQGYRGILRAPDIPRIYHDRDFIYMLRELRFELTKTTIDGEEAHIVGITPSSVLRAIENNFNGVGKDEFEKLIEIFYQAVQRQCPDFRLPSTRRSVPSVLYESMKLDSLQRRHYGRFKLIIDESEDESAVRLLSQNGILNLDPSRTTVFRMSDFPDDIDNELRNVEILSKIKLCMEAGKTILMVNTGRVHGALYDVFNQNFSIMATGDMRKIFSKVAIGPKTIDVVVHEDFQCIVHVKRSEFQDIPAPFLSRFQKYSLSIIDFYHIRFGELPHDEQTIMKNVEYKLHSFIEHFGRQYFYGLSENTLYSCLLSVIKQNGDDQNTLINIHQNYTQLMVRSKSFIEQHPGDIQLCILRFILTKLIQLVSPEAVILKLPTFEDKIARWLCTIYFYQQEHFHIENFIHKLTSDPSMYSGNDDLLTTMNASQQKTFDIKLTRKVMIFTRTSPHVIGLGDPSNNGQLFPNLNTDDDPYYEAKDNIDIINLSVIENSFELEERFQNFERHDKKNVLIIVINSRIIQQRLHIPYVRQLIDKTEYSTHASNKKQDKYFLLLIHSPAHEQYHQSSFPSIFLDNWDIYFFDTCAPGSGFLFQKMLQILSLSSDQQEQYESIDTTLCDLNTLFNNCLWDFCSRIQITLQELPSGMFKNNLAQEFYKRQTNTVRRTQCLRGILQKSRQLQNRIVTAYHDQLSKKKESSKKIYNLIYQISKDILCGRRFDGLVESIQCQTQVSFTNFVSNVLKFIVNDYGLETLVTSLTVRNGYESMLELIDYSTITIDDENDDHLNPSNNQGIISLVAHYTFIPQTPLYHLFHQRVKSYAEQIKLKRIFQQIGNKGEQNDHAHYQRLPITTADNCSEETESNEFTLDHFRNELVKSLLNDKVLSNIVNEDTLKSYSNDLVRTQCTIVEKNFDGNSTHCMKAIEFISRWLLLVDEDDQKYFEECSNRHIWLLAHIYASFEYECNDLFSLYSACLILDRYNSTEKFYNDLFTRKDVSRSKVRESVFRLMFDNLWQSLLEFCSKSVTSQTWIDTYTYIAKYYPSDKVLQRMKLVEIKNQLEFMNLAYLILLNDKTPEPKDLVSLLWKDIYVVHAENNRHNLHQGKPIYLEVLPAIINNIQQYLENKNIKSSTLLIDLQQWIVSILKSLKQSCKDEIIGLLRDLNQSACHLPLPMKQLFFEKLSDLFIESHWREKTKPDFWDRLLVILPLIVDSLTIDTESLSRYELPYHPSSVHNDHQRQPLIDLFFFYLHRSFNDAIIKFELAKKIMQSNIANVRVRDKKMGEELLKKLKDHFLIRIVSILLCQTDVSPHDQRLFNSMTSAVINQYLSVNQQTTKLNQHIEIFLSTIVSKRSWHCLSSLLKSDYIQNLDSQWANTLCDLLKLQQTIQQNSYLQLSHKLQFSLSVPNDLNIFPKLHGPYQEIKDILKVCVQENTNDQPWERLSDWIELKKQENPSNINLKEMKVILLLNIYYDYYCNNQLTSICTLIDLIEDTLEPSPEELRVFRAILQPEQFMIGYSAMNDNADGNFLNRLFTLDCIEEDELCIRHCLVNLLAMILMGGKESFLWTFVFNPLALENTFGFGSTAHRVIRRDGVHYDCGCIITQNGDLMQFDQIHASKLNIPAVYVAYFLTFGALAWNLLLFNESTENLYGPILARHAIDDTTAYCRIAGESNRTKVCHFVRARLLSTFNFLSIRSNQDDACILLNHCFEQMAFLTINHEQEENSWIKPIFNSLDDELKAEDEFQSNVFYFVHEKMAQYKAFIHQLNLQSQIQADLQNYIAQMPIIVQFHHFRTELHNSIHSHLPLRILRRVFDSTNFLKLTKWIYHLGQFYILLHQTYSQLIEQEEFHQITLEELYNRGQKYCNKQNNNYSSIIDNGINGINAYHEFTDGLIRPGACDQTQHFTKVTHQTPVHYLVTSSNYDEGDIIMRILSVLVDNHNSLLTELEQEVNNNENHIIGALKDLVLILCSKEVSILQILNDKSGVITLNEDDCLWIERLSCATLINENDEYFQKADARLAFDFLYLQSYIIRTYLLFCRINYRHIIQNYLCHVQEMPTTTDSEILSLDSRYSAKLSDEQLEDDWSHLKEMQCDKIYNGYAQLRKIATLLKHEQNDASDMCLYEFIQSFGDDQNISELIQQYEIKNFRLCYISHILQLYANCSSGYEYLFTDVSQLLRAPIDVELDEQFQQELRALGMSVDDSHNTDGIMSLIRVVTDLLDGLRTIEHFLVRESAQSLRETCKILSIENSLLDHIPTEIKCKNYVPVSIHLIRMRTTLQERVVNIEVQQKIQWNEKFNTDFTDEQMTQGNIYSRYLREPLPEPSDKTENEQISLNDDEIWKDLPSEPSNNSTINDLLDDEPNIVVPKKDCLEYSSIFELHLKLIPLTTAFERIHNECEEQPSQSTVLNKGFKFSVTYVDSKVRTHLWKIENLFDRLKSLFENEKYDINTFAVVDKNEVFLDFTNPNIRLPQNISLEYFIIEKALLYYVRFNYDDREFEYLATAKCNIPLLINRCIGDNQITLSSPNKYLCFFDHYGRVIDDRTIGDLLNRTNSIENKTINIIAIEQDSQTDMFCEVTLRFRTDVVETCLFHRTTQWQQIDQWLKNWTQVIGSSANEYAYFDRNRHTVIDQSHSIDLTVEGTESAVVDGIDRDATISVIFSYQTYHVSVSALKSMKIYQILNDEHILKELNLIDISPNDCVLIVGDTNDRILSQNDIQQAVGNYSTNDNQPIHFRIAISIEILKYDVQQFVNIVVPSRNTTMQQIFDLANASRDDYQYIASDYSRQILDFNEKLSNLIGTKFILVRRYETCLVSIRELQNDNQLTDINNGEVCKEQNFAMFATIGDIYKANQININHQYLLYSEDFIPSKETAVISLLSSTTPIQFTLIDHDLPVRATVEFNEDKKKVEFNCSTSVTVERLRSFACQLFDINKQYYRLMDSDCVLDDEDISLEDMDSTMTQIQLQLVPTATIKCSIKYEDQTIILPCSNNTLASTIIEEALKKLHIPIENIHSFELMALDETQTPIESDIIIEDIFQLFSTPPTTIPFELKNNHQ